MTEIDMLYKINSIYKLKEASKQIKTKEKQRFFLKKISGRGGFIGGILTIYGKINTNSTQNLWKIEEEGKFSSLF